MAAQKKKTGKKAAPPPQKQARPVRREVGGFVCLLLALCAAAAARFSQAQRRGKFSIAPIAALALTIGGFFPRMGAASTFIWAFVAAAGAGLCVVLLQKGETEDAEKQDFRVRQDA